MASSADSVGPPSRTSSAPPSAPPSAAPRSAAALARERARAEVVAAILDTGRDHLARHGAAALSLRAVARDLGMVSSNVYRYVASRDDLLTALIVDAYDDLGETVETAEAEVARDDIMGRWVAIGDAVRTWALARPHEWALLYGSPVPGYVAPETTIGPGTRVSMLLVTLLADLWTSGRLEDRGWPAISLPASAALQQMRSLLPPSMPDTLVVRGLMARATLVGLVSQEVFGDTSAIISTDPELAAAFVRSVLLQVGFDLGLPASEASGLRG